jgi:hypothetical protein
MPNDPKRTYRERHPERVKQSQKRAYLKRRERLGDEQFYQQVRQVTLKTRYGITSELYQEMLADQNGVCAVCCGPSSRTHFDVDHNHATGTVRGLLCNRCNAALGFLNEDPLRIRALAQYIEQHNAK